MAYAARPRIGVSNVVYALLTESSDVAGGTPAWGTVYSLPNVTNVNFNSASSLTTLYADDGPRFAADTVGDMSFSFTLADINPDDEARLLGHTRTNGVTIKNATDTSPYVAIGFRVLRSGKESSNAVYSYYWFHKVLFQKPNVEQNTKGASIEFTLPVLEGRVTALISNNQYMTTARTDDATVSATTLTNWFNQPVVGSADLNALNAAIAKSSTNVAITFTKTGGGNLSMPADYLTTNTIPIVKGTAIQAGTYGVSGNGTASVVVTFTPTVAFGTASVAVTVTNQVRDSYGVAATPAASILSFP